MRKRYTIISNIYVRRQNVGQTRHLLEFEVTPTEVMAPRARDGRKMRAIIIAADTDRKRTAVAFRRMTTGASLSSLLLSRMEKLLLSTDQSESSVFCRESFGGSSSLADGEVTYYLCVVNGKFSREFIYH